MVSSSESFKVYLTEGIYILEMTIWRELAGDTSHIHQKYLIYICLEAILPFLYINQYDIVNNCDVDCMV